MAAGFVGLETRNLSENVITETQVMTAQFIVMVKQNGRTITMSILIKGMEMPKPKFTDMAAVYGAYVLVRPNGHVSIVVDNEDGLDSTEYPLVPVPPHGDLIDKKNLSDDLQRRWNVSDDQDFCNKEVWHALEEAPTIIEAEE